MSEGLGDFVDAITGAPKGSTDTWIGRVKQADAEAEARYAELSEYDNGPVIVPASMTAYALIAIAAELRAQRIARRPGAGQ